MFSVGGYGISLDNCWRITVDHRMHITCCATGDTNCLNNISYLFHQQEEGESLTYDTPSLS